MERKKDGENGVTRLRERAEEYWRDGELSEDGEWNTTGREINQRTENQGTRERKDGRTERWKDVASTYVLHPHRRTESLIYNEERDEN